MTIGNSGNSLIYGYNVLSLTHMSMHTYNIFMFVLADAPAGDIHFLPETYLNISLRFSLSHLSADFLSIFHTLLF